MMDSTLSPVRPGVDHAGTGIVSHAGVVLPARVAEASGLVEGLSEALEPWRASMAVFDPGRMLTQLALSIAAGGDCLADVRELAGAEAIVGPVPSEATTSRLISALAADVDRVETVTYQAIRKAREHVWTRTGDQSPLRSATATDPIVVDIDATLITAHSDKEHAAPTYKKGYGHHPLLAYCDHGPGGGGEPLAALLRPGNAGANTATDHKKVLATALKALPGVNACRPGRRVLVRTDRAGASHAFLEHLHRKRAQYSIGFALTPALAALVDEIPDAAWQCALNSDGDVREGAEVVELTGMADLGRWPAGMRLIVRAERPHPGAQLRFTDADGRRLTAFVTNTRRGQLQDLELRHRRRARCEDRIRAAKDTGLANLPLQSTAQNRIWLLVSQLAQLLIAWSQLTALADTPAARWEPKRLRLRLLGLAAKITRHSRQTMLHLDTSAPWAHLITAGLARLAAPG